MQTEEPHQNLSEKYIVGKRRIKPDQSAIFGQEFQEHVLQVTITLMTGKIAAETSLLHSDSCGSNSPALYEQHPILGRNFSRSDSVDVNAARNSNNTDLNDILVSIFFEQMSVRFIKGLLLEPVVSK